jgi:hypothetical protein
VDQLEIALRRVGYPRLGFALNRLARYMSLDSKACSKCKTDKPLSEFHNWKQRQDGLCPHCKVCVTEYWKAYHSTRPDARYMVHVKKYYNLSAEQYKSIFESQGGRCAACGGQPDGKGRLHVDHDHSCCPAKISCGECVRSLLCHSCNLTVGHSQESVERLLAVAKYLESFNVIR